MSRVINILSAQHENDVRLEPLFLLSNNGKNESKMVSLAKNLLMSLLCDIHSLKWNVGYKVIHSLLALFGKVEGNYGGANCNEQGQSMNSQGTYDVDKYLEGFILKSYPRKSVDNIRNFHVFAHNILDFTH